MVGYLKSAVQGFDEQLDLFRVIIDAATETDGRILVRLIFDLVGMEDLIDIAETWSSAMNWKSREVMVISTWFFYTYKRSFRLSVPFPDHGTGQIFIQEAFY